MLILLAVTSLLFAALLIKAVITIQSKDEVIAGQNYWHGKLREFVFDHAKFPDESGKADAPYNGKEVEQKWNYFHEIDQEYRKVVRK